MKKIYFFLIAMLIAGKTFTMIPEYSSYQRFEITLNSGLPDAQALIASFNYLTNLLLALRVKILQDQLDQKPINKLLNHFDNLKLHVCKLLQGLRNDPRHLVDSPEIKNILKRYDDEMYLYLKYILLGSN